MRFNTAAEVRKFLKDKGFVDKMKIRKMSNPFGGDDKFVVSFAVLPEGVAILSSSGSKTPTRFGSDDGGKTAARLQAMYDTLEGTNAFAST